MSLVLEAAGSWLRCQFHTAVVSFMKSMQAVAEAGLPEGRPHLWRTSAMHVHRYVEVKGA